MKNNIIKLISLSLCLSAILSSIVSCSDGVSTDSESTSTPIIQTTESAFIDTTEESTDSESENREPIIITEDSAVVSVNIADNSKFLYRILRDTDASGSVKDKISSLRKFLDEKTGHQPEYKAGNALADPTPYNNDYEILIGDTVRAESTAAAECLWTKDYFVGVVGNKIVIVGGSNEATCDAIDYFMNEICSDASSDRITMQKGYFYRHDYVDPDMSIANVHISEFALKYYSGATMDSNVAASFAKKIQGAVGEYNGYHIEPKAVNPSSPRQTYEILIGPVGYGYAAEFHAGLSDPLAYGAKVVDGKLYICGGGEWAVEYAVDHIIDNYISAGVRIGTDFEFSGTLYAKQLFELEDRANVRIMANNVWNKDNNNTTWSNMGEDCSATVRAKGLTACYMAFKPDVINVQEMSKKMLGYIIENFTAAGYNYAATETIKMLNIIYNTDTLTLVEHGYYIFPYGCDASSKGYAWALFEHKESGERFVSMSTHLWWKSEADAPGSDTYRENQANEIADKCSELATLYNCPVFVGGDFNARTSNQAIKNIIDKGMKNAFDTAPKSDNLSSHHPCGPDGFERGNAGINTQAIDHMFYCNLGDSVLNSFRRTQPFFFIKLSDHYPLYVDVTLK